MLEIPFNDNTSEAYERWQKTPVPLFMKFTFFVCRNADTYTNLSDIELEERGPYVYEEIRFKQNITVYDDEISYLENKTYKFRPDLSKHGLSEDDNVTIVNFPMMGYTLLEPEWTVNNEHDPTTDIWINDPFVRHCNKLKGTDGQFFKPNLEKGDTIYAFEPQLCRSVYFKYWKESEVQDIDTYRFRVPQEYFQCPLVNKDNTCYCNRPNITLCNRNGMLDISHCQYRSFGAPIIMSSPYWNNGDPTLRTQFKSELKPLKELNDDNYGTYLDIEPITGTTLRAYRRMQMSIRISGRDEDEFKLYYPQLAKTNKSIEYIVPGFWVEETAEADGDQADKWKSMVGNKVKLGKGLSIAAITSFLIM
ncbi:unnamed protein product [Medioppia subpectinata]|uniref:Uncharacterized protein n=1 Tax=Medioppia subpectinata TaxID=1979941 RepID=A0A7R9KLM9_9ACAR|nr:unnamed protein product [Medioppia subpectinata]CAG2104540.1 unnamed protein product [Medioppia subpectinata]